MTLQGIAAVIAGFAAMAAVVMAGTALAAMMMGRDMASMEAPPPGYLPFDFGLGQVAALLGGVVVARLAPSVPLAHAVGLSALVLAMAVYCIVAARDNGPPRWYQALLSLTSAAVVVAGAWLTS